MESIVGCIQRPLVVSKWLVSSEFSLSSAHAGNRLDELATCSKCKYKLYMCTCTAGGLEHDLSGKYSEEDGNDLKVYSEKFKNKRIVLAPEKKKKKDSLYGDDSDDDKAQRSGPKRIGTAYRLSA